MVCVIKHIPVYKVEKALYGLHQAPRAWYETLSTYLLDNGFQRGKIDKTFFIRRDKGDILLVQVYVDDIIFCSTKKSLCIEFKKMMHKKFQMSSMGELTFFLGLQVKQKDDGIFISQDKYVTEILKKFSFTDVKTASTPMETQKPLLKDEDGEEVDVHLYRSMNWFIDVNLTSSDLILFAVVPVKTINGEVQLQALVDGNKIIVTKASVRRDLQLDDEEGTNCLPNATTFEELTRMRYEKLSQKLTFYKAFFSPQWKFLIHTILQCLSAKTTAWNEFSSTMASEIICLATNQKFNFSKYIFESMVKNLDNVNKFFMYPRRVGKGFSGRETPLFQTMVVQDQTDMGKGLAIPTDPRHTPIITKPSTSQPQKKQRPRKTKRKETEIPQSSGPIDNVADEAFNEEMDDSLERAATTATSLDAEQDMGNINKTKSKGTPNEPSSSGTSSGGGARRQETMGDTIAQPRSENVSTLKELMELCTNLQNRVIDLENTKTTQAQEITSSKDYTRLGMCGDDLMFDSDVLDDKEVFAGQDMAEKEVSTTDPVTTVGEVVTIADELTLAQTLIDFKTAKPKVKGVVIGEQSESTTRTRPQQLPSKDKGKEKRRKHFAAKRVEEQRNKPPTKAQQKKTMITYLKNMEGWKHKDLRSEGFDSIKELFDKAFKRVNTFVDYRTEVMEESSKKAEAEVTEGSSKRAGDELEQEEEEVTVDAIPLATKPPSIVDWKILKEGNISYYQIIRVRKIQRVYYRWKIYNCRRVYGVGTEKDQRLSEKREEQPNERTPSPPPRKKYLSPPQTPSKSISSKSTHYTSSSSTSESLTPTHVAPPPKLFFVIPIKEEPQELPPLQISPNDPLMPQNHV
ncbi:putative ribonuclease H-like domain-containing protein [Tanacetum coccineum]